MDIQKIRFAAAVYSTGSFTKAASALHVTQPLLSQQISALEKEIGFTLFQRTTRSVVPTEHGVFFCKQAAEVLKEYDTLRNLVRIHSKNYRDTITIVTAPRISSIELPKAITDYYRLGSQITISYTELEESQLAHLAEEEDSSWDVAVLRSTDSEDLRNLRNMSSCVLLRDPIVLLCADNHPLRSRKSVSPDDLRDQSIVFGSPDSIVYKEMENVFDEDYIRSRNIPVFSNSHNLMKDLVQSGLAVAIGNRSLAYHYGLSYIPLDIDMSNDVYMIWKTHVTKPVIRNFIDYLMDYYADDAHPKM
ncbi:MAG: LysR family transcriptional regulator [Solobacterium sp.]|nr:LysR family transcriptional regulator [Solobacterium sp.]